MPICPRCNATIHSGAEDQCPACGYGMERADRIFGTNDIEFTRVVDEAGALTHRERMELLHFLAEQERRIPPVALCIYITDHGQTQEFRPHAHWALNHARIHSPSFGRREQIRAIEDAELRERRPGEGRPAEEETPSWFNRNWQGICDWCRDLFLPTPPPARQDWIFMLVLDVQLELACFSWGYMLDPYIYPDKINSTIIGARLQFRERAMVTALKKVMKDAVGEIAKASRRENKKMRQNIGLKRHMLPWMATAGLGATLLGTTPAQAEPAGEAPAAAEQTAATVPATPTPEQAAAPAEQAPAPPPEIPGVAASYNAAPKWSSTDYTHLMSGRLPECYNLLMPGGKQKTDPARRDTTTRKRNRDNAEQESDTKVPGRYCKLYLDPRGTALRDPQMLLSDVERQDISHVLRELNAHSRFHIYVSIFKDGQEIPRELAATNLVTNVAQPGQYTLMLQYAVGEPPSVDIGYKEIKPTDEQMREWLQAVRRSVMAAGGGTEGLIAGIRRLHAAINPLSVDFTPLTPETSGTVRRIELPFQNEEKVEEVSMKVKAKQWIEAGGATPFITFGSAAVLILGLFSWLIHWHRSCGRLFATEPDYRLSSRYGAGVSRYVKYLEGKEAGKEKQLF
ncbi:MAG: hypothetical protein IKZ13_00210 [Akkermansia sp.]|nr:hypothetical protein [Akkermansia sp.]